LLRAVGRHLFGGAYDAEAGIVRHAGVGDRLGPAACGIPAGRAADPHIRFFLARNPRYALGDELACITDVSRENLRQTSYRLIERTPTKWIGVGGPATVASGPAAMDAPGARGMAREHAW
jgi:hypothetical protein